MGILIPLIIVIICCIIIWRASDGFTTASDYIGRNLSEGVRGATINAVASSMPEVFTSIFFLFYLKDVNGFSGGIGATAGSAIFNSMIIPAFVILAVVFSGFSKKINVSPKVYLRDGISLIVAEIIFIIIISGTSLNWHHGLILILVYVFYILFMFRTMKRNRCIDVSETNTFINPESSKGSLIRGIATFDFERVFIGKATEMNNKLAWSLLFGTTFAMATVCFMLVQACEWLGSEQYTIPMIGTYHGLGIPVIFIAVILAAAASSIPDTIISIKDAKKGNYDDAVSNALGSNIFDICFALGFPLFLYTLIYGPIHMTQDIIELSSELRMLLLILTVITIAIYIFGKGLGLTKAIMLLSMYGIFTLYIVGVSSGHPISMQIAHSLRDFVFMMRLQ
jgi:Ca2+/Na+ antiporter